MHRRGPKTEDRRPKTGTGTGTETGTATGIETGTATATRTDTDLFAHHQLIGYRLALELVKLVASIEIGDANLRAQARKSAASARLASR